MENTTAATISATRPWAGLDRAWVSLRGFRLHVDNVHLWVVQGMIMVITVVPVIIESRRLWHWPSERYVALSFGSISLLLVPVLYAASKFGPRGVIATAVWSALLSVPNLLVSSLHMNAQAEFQSELVALAVFGACSVVVATYVARERDAGQAAAAAASEARESEARYRVLFESSPEAVLVLSPAGTVTDSNPAAEGLFGVSAGALKGRALGNLIGAASAEALLASPKADTGKPSRIIAIRPAGGSTSHVRPVAIQVPGSGQGTATQVVLEDVSLEVQREADLRTYATRLLEAQEEERKRLARNLHDDVVQRMSLVCRHLGTLQTGRSECSAAEVQEASMLAEGVVRTLRDFARALRPQLLEDLGLMPALRRLLLDLEARAGIRGRFHISGKEQRLSPDVELQVFRMVQEALCNVERHSRAALAELSVRWEPGVLNVTVTDDGVGFILPAGRQWFSPEDHLGLLGMRERANLIGARLDITSTPGAGTRVAVSGVMWGGGDPRHRGCAVAATHT